MTNSIGSFFHILRRYLRAEWHRLALLSMMTLVMLALRLIAPQWLRIYVQHVEASQSLSLIQSSVLIYLAINLARHAINTGSRYLSESIGLSCTDALRVDLAEHVLALDMSYHKEHTPGEMITRLDQDVSGLSGFFAKFWDGMLVGVLSLIGTLATLCFLAPVLGAALVLSTSIILGITFWLKDYTVPYLEAEYPLAAAHYSAMEEHFAAGEDLRANGGVGYVMKRFFETYSAFRKAYYKAYMAHSTLWSTTQLGVSINSALTFGIGYWMWQQGQADIGVVFMLVNYSEQLRLPLSQLRTRLQDLQRAEASLRRIGETLQVQPLLHDDGVSPLGDTALDLCFEKVEFGYEEGQKVIDALDFTLPAGQVLGLLGRTGSGKSTLARLLARFYDPREGQITLGAQPLSAYPLQELRRGVAFVTQEVQLFRASIRDNLTFFDSGIDDDTILAALERLDLSDWLAAQPHGLDSLLGDEVGLSAGESQLLALARAFLRHPVLVVLDEASARLDPVTERRLNAAMSRMLEGRTGIIIAHRLATLEKVDQILILEEGRLLEHGPRNLLVQNPQSHFARLLTLGNLEAME